MPFRRKLQFLLVLLVGISCGLLVWMSLRKANRLAFELIQERVYSIAVSTAPQVDGDAVASLVSREQEDSDLYRDLRDGLRAVRDANRSSALPVRFIYVIRPLGDGNWEYVVDAEEESGSMSHIGELVEFNRESEKPEMNFSRADEHFVKDSFGIWLSAFSPVYNTEGEAVAVLGVDIAASRIQALLRKLLIGDLVAMFFALVLAAALAAWLSRMVTRPLTELRDFVREIARGNFASRVQVESNDEFGELADAVNRMAEGLEERDSLRGALVHYVRSQAADTKLTSNDDEGQESTRRTTALVAELCGFSQLSSRLGSERVFALLNEYFSTMIDVILRNGGSLEKSSDESVIAVFGSAREDLHQERHAIEAALAMQSALAQLLKDWGVTTNTPIFLEIGIHSGDALVRHRGERDQLDFESAHRIVETAASIAKVGRRLGNRLTVSDTTAENLHHTFPLTPIEEDELDYAIFRVAMPEMKMS